MNSSNKIKIIKKFPKSYVLKLSRDESLLARIGGSVYIYSSNDYKQIGRFLLPKYPCDISFSADNKKIAIVSTTGKLIVYDSESQTQLLSKNLKKCSDSKIDFLDNEWLAITCFDSTFFFNINNLELIDTKKEELLSVSKFISEENSYFMYNPNGNILSKSNPELYNVDIEKKLLIRNEKINIPYDCIEFKVDLSQEYLLLLSLTEENVKNSGDCHFASFIGSFFEELESKSHCIKPELYTSLNVYNVKTYDFICSIVTSLEIKGVIISYDSRFLAFDIDNVLYVLDCLTQQIVLKFDEEYLCLYQFTFDCKKIMIGTWNSGYIIDLLSDC